MVLKQKEFLELIASVVEKKRNYSDAFDGESKNEEFEYIFKKV